MTHPLVFDKVIGKGTHGVVYAGYHKQLERIVAIKKVRDTLSSRHEVSAIQQVQGCANVVKYYSTYIDKEDDSLLMVMELCDGTPTDKIVANVRQGNRLSEHTVRTVAQGVANALLHCHERQLLYGDMKPSNIICGLNGEAKLIDFGCTRKGLAYTSPLGTPLYFAPEKFSHDFGLPSDVWSFGIVLYMLVAGHHPFVHTPHYGKKLLSGLDELHSDIEATALTFHHPHWDGISDSLKDLIACTLRKDARKRMAIEYVVAHDWWSANL